ncbi:hypothetical protein NC653_038020 [Populus alba x Populus x berolinensis]|uniref:Uncharacterized protein n=1 Tax=Populus alba x Populus x berolinensis TaxID=444605 RepID=A0AAD6PUB5_9ROSI|nr:hypothetical protein NC653_038020 [Populus alba x Populus x berolinensis]
MMEKTLKNSSFPRQKITSRYKWSVKELHKMLHWCNEQLQQFNHVNKKALDQHVNLIEKQEELQISDLFQTYIVNDRHQLLHVGAGHRVLFAFVEIVFDNSDKCVSAILRAGHQVLYAFVEIVFDNSNNRIPDVFFNCYLLESSTSSMLAVSASTIWDHLHFRWPPQIAADLTIFVIVNELKEARDFILHIRRRDLYQFCNEFSVPKDKLEHFKDITPQDIVCSQDDATISRVLAMLKCKREIQDAHEESKDLEKLEVDGNDLRERISGHIQAKVSNSNKEKNSNAFRMMLQSNLIFYKEIQDAYEESKDLEKDVHEESKDLEKVLKDLTKEVYEFSREKEEAEKRQTKTIKSLTELEVDRKDLRGRISRHIQANDDATKQLDILQREIQDAHEDSKNLETVLKDLTKEVQEFSREQEEAERQ